MVVDWDILLGGCLVTLQLWRLHHNEKR